MPVDLTGGLGDEREYVCASQPDDPEMRESVNAWIWDSGAEYGFPRIGVEAVADQWETHDVQVNIALADGRVLNIFEPGKVHEPLGADGTPRTLGAGPLAFELVEPFRHWRMRLDGMAVVTTVQDKIRGVAPAPDVPRAPVEIEVDLHHAVPPWENGALLEDAARVLETQEEGSLMGGPRFEQLARAAGTVRIDGQTHRLDGGGLRIRRQGIRRMARFWGHAWQSSLFPSGRAFGYIVYPPREDGKPTYNEGYIFEGDGTLVPARVVQAPWLGPLQASGEDVSVVLQSERGTHRIAGESLLSTFSVMKPDTGPGLHLQQAIVRYTWEGETANGMMERSIPT